jgi:cyclophilin family peptidyl-prolyl cis-trans isomerase
MGTSTKRRSARRPLSPGYRAAGKRCRAGGRAGLCLKAFCQCLAVFACLFSTSQLCANPFVRLDYNISLGNRLRETVFIELFDDRPLTRDNFLAYVNSGEYDNSLMHRLAYEGTQPFVLQGGGYHPVFQTEPPPLDISLDPDAQVDLDGNPNTPNPTVNNEFGNSPFRSNVRGTLAMAKLGGNPNSATSEYFFNLKDNGGTAPNGLDFQNGGFTVFARVVGDGMNLIGAYSGTSPSTGLPRLNLNEDANDNGVPDAGPFNDVPVLPNQTFSTFIPLTLDHAEQIDYLGSGLTTNVPAGGLTFSTRNTYIDTGTVFTGSGALTIGAGRTLGMREGFSLNRPLINFGTLAPGLQLGTITVQSFRQDPGASLEIELRGTTADRPNDQLVVTDGALLGGDLDVTLLSGFAPVAGNTFTILTAGLIGDTFDNINLPLLSPGLVWDVNQTATAFTLSVAAADFNQDGIVDAADYVVWRRTNGTQTQFNIWRANYGNTRGGSFGGGSASQAAHAVPEPSSAVLLVACGFLFAMGRRFVGRRPV